jgi:hypothetical protein
VIRLSCASTTVCCIHCKRSAANLSVGVSWDGVMIGESMQGDLPNCNWNGVSPVEQLSVFIMSNLILVNDFTHPNWSCSTVKQMH